MSKPHPNLNAILVGGSSHVGKSAVSGSLAATLGWDHVSTDSLARHPGRPWKAAPEKVPEHVAQHYLCLSVDDLIEDVLHHYRVNVWPQVEAIVASHSNDTCTTGIVLEGSALLPELVTGLDSDRIAAVWLTAREEVFRQRIHSGSLYSSKSSRERKMIDKFLQRTLAYNARMVDTVRRHGFILVDVLQSNVTELTKRCLSTLGFEDGDVYDVDLVDYHQDEVETMAMKNPPHPGHSIRENCLDGLGLIVTEAAKVLGVARHTLSRLLNGQAAALTGAAR